MAVLQSAKAVLISGRAEMVLSSARNSLALAVPYTMRVISRSMSLTPTSAWRTVSRSIGQSNNSPTAFWRRRIWLTLSSGRSTQARIIRLPMAVLVLSITHSSECFLSPVIMERVSSKLRRALMSRCINRSLS